MCSTREGVCGNNAVPFQSCDGSSYCTLLGGNDCTDIVSCQLRVHTVIRFLHAQKQSPAETISVPCAWTQHYEPQYGQTMVWPIHWRPNQCVRWRPGDARTDGKCGQAVLQNRCFTISELTPVVQWLSHSPLDLRLAGSILAGVDGFFRA